MDYSAVAGKIWRHHDLSHAARDYVSLVRYATLAASSHNTQPWKFKPEPGRIVILPDLSRRRPAVDPDDHHLYASLGCAAENLPFAAQAAGLQGHVSYDASESSVYVVFDAAAASRGAQLRTPGPPIHRVGAAHGLHQPAGRGVPALRSQFASLSPCRLLYDNLFEWSCAESE